MMGTTYPEQPEMLLGREVMKTPTARPEL